MVAVVLFEQGEYNVAILLLPNALLSLYLTPTTKVGRSGIKDQTDALPGLTSSRLPQFLDETGIERLPGIRNTAIQFIAFHKELLIPVDPPGDADTKVPRTIGH